MFNAKYKQHVANELHYAVLYTIHCNPYRRAPAIDYFKWLVINIKHIGLHRPSTNRNTLLLICKWYHTTESKKTFSSFFNSVEVKLHTYLGPTKNFPPSSKKERVPAVNYEFSSEDDAIESSQLTTCCVRWMPVCEGHVWCYFTNICWLQYNTQPFISFTVLGIPNHFYCCIDFYAASGILMLCNYIVIVKQHIGSYIHIR